MNNIIEKIKNNKLLFVFLTVIFLCIVFLSANSLYAPDEFNFSNIPWTAERVDSFSDIVLSMKMIYLNTGGRIPAHALAYIFLFLQMHLFDVLNAFVFIMYLYVSAKFFCKKNIKLGIILSSFVVTFLMPMFGEMFIWLTGSCVYLWMTTIAIIYLYYLYEIVINDYKLKSWEKVALYILAFIAGWSQELTAIIIGLSIGMLGLINIKKIFSFEKKKLFYLIGSVIVFGIGALLLFLAPGSYNRLEESSQKIYLDNFMSVISQAKTLIVLFVVSTVIVFFKKSERGLWKNKLLYIVIPAIIGIAPMVLLEQFVARAMLTFDTFLMICLVSNCVEIIDWINFKKDTINKIIGIIVMVIVVCPLMQLTFSFYKYVKPYKENLVYQIESAKLRGQNEVVVSEFKHYDKINSRYNMLPTYPNLLNTTIINQYMAVYYGVNAIYALDDNCSLIEIDITDEEKYGMNNDYELVNSNGDFIAARWIDNTLVNRIIFVIENKNLDDIKLKTDRDISILSTKVKNISKIEDINLELYN